MADALLETAASQFVESYGSSALLVLQQRAEVAEEHGREVAATTWRAIAAAAALLLADIESRNSFVAITDTKAPLPGYAGPIAAHKRETPAGRW